MATRAPHAAATKPFGFRAFYSGPGIRGRCIPVDPLYPSWKMRPNGYEARFIHRADEINRAMPARRTVTIRAQTQSPRMT